MALSTIHVPGTGQVYGWGNNEYGQLGVLSKDEQASKPVYVELPNLDTDGPLVSMATGGAFTAFLTGKGLIFLLVNYQSSVKEQILSASVDGLHFD